MKTNTIKTLFIAAILISVTISCKNQLDVKPAFDITDDVVYSSVGGYKQAVAKVYGSFALTGNAGPAGNGDVQGIDEGTSDFFRLFWCAQELTTDEAVIAWGDAGLPDLHNLSFTSNNDFLKGLYYRSIYQITLANDFIRQSEDAKVSSRGITGADANEVKNFRNEARFLRAYQYWVLLDLFANPPFVTENDLLGATLPKQTNRADLFAYVESELKDLENVLVDAKQNEYGRADKGAAWALLARLYLNAKVYTGTDHSADAAIYAKKVIDGGYSLISDPRQLMLADNNLNKDEFILTINYDGVRTQGYGGTTFLTHASVGGSMSAAAQGVGGGWFGIRTTKNLVNLFPSASGTPDRRAQFYTAGQNLEVNEIGTFTDGYAVTKFRNVNRDGAVGSSLDFADIDIPIFRLGEVYLIYAEALLRSGGSEPTAVAAFNKLRERAYGNATGNVSSLTLDMVLEERGRELFWEGYRRTDLIRYGRFTEAGYLWPFKGGVKGGRGVEAFRNIFPLPAADVTANSNLVQNTGY